jgi:hypothetical protein
MADSSDVGSHSSLVNEESTARSIVRVDHRSRYFQTMSLLLFAFVLLGFARTLFLRPLFHVPPIAAWYLYVHGAVLTTWFALFVAQTSLIAAHRTDLHRRLGIAGAFLAIAVFAIALITVVGLPAHFKAGRVSTEGSLDFAAVSGSVWTDFAALALFATFVATALYLRQRSDVHRRLMLLASLAIVVPAVARLPIPAMPVRLLILLALPLSLVVYDVWSLRRVHRTTAWGVASYFVAYLGSAWVSFTNLGHALIKFLE